MLHRYIAILLLLLSFHQSIAQDGTKGMGSVTTTDDLPKKGTTYAVVVGISKYQDSINIPNLRFADADAKAFTELLVNSWKVDRNNIFTYYNDSATTPAIVTGISRLSEKITNGKIKEGDNVIIYFSGHGGAYTKEYPYLFTHNTIGADPNLYGIFALPIPYLKTTFKTWKNNNINVFLITDACRDNEDNGKVKTSNIALQNSMENFAGEVLIASCRPNEKAREDEKWGGGRGVFSYYLTQALMGMADLNNDTAISIDEVMRYVKDSVTASTMSVSLKKPLQEPYSNGNMFPGDLTLGVYDQALKTQYIASKNKGSNKKDIASSQGTRHKSQPGNVDGATQALLDKFSAAMTQSRYVEPGGDNAWYYLGQLKQTAADKDWYYELQDQLLVTIGNELTEVVADYLQADPKRKPTAATFNNAAHMAQALKQIVGPGHYFATKYEATRLFLEAKALANASGVKASESEMKTALAKCDSAIVLEPAAAHIYNTKGLLYMNAATWDSALTYLAKAHTLAPQWLYPITNTGICYTQLKQYEKAREAMESALRIDSTYATAWLNLGAYYQQVGKSEIALSYYEKALAIDPSQVAVLTTLGDFYTDGAKYEKAMDYYQRALTINAGDATALAGLGKINEQKGNLTEAVKQYKQVLAQNPHHAFVLNRLAYIYQKEGKIFTALQYAIRALKVDPTYGFAWENLYFIYYNLQEFQLAAAHGAHGDVIKNKALIAANAKDAENWIALAQAYGILKQYDNAINAVNTALKLAPANAFAAKMLTDLNAMKAEKDFDEQYLVSMANAEPGNEDRWNDLALYYENTGQFDKAFVNLEMAMKVMQENILLKYRLAVISEPANIQHAWKLANVFLSFGANDSALYYFNKATQIAPDNYNTWLTLGGYYRGIDSNALAKQYFLKSLEVNSKANKYGHYLLGEMTKQEKDYATALKYFETAYKIAPDEAIYKGLIECCTQTGDSKKQKKYTEELSVWKVNNPVKK